MKLFGQIISIQPLALLISLPNQLFGHVPITQISSQFTNILETMEEDENRESVQEDDEDGLGSRIPELTEIFHLGQYVRTMVTAVHAPGSADMSGIGRARDEAAKASRRVELSLVPEKVNSGVQISDLRGGFVRIFLLSNVTVLNAVVVQMTSRPCRQPSKASKTTVMS
jgi:rRNA biogenesis protein RRP5